MIFTQLYEFIDRILIDKKKTCYRRDFVAPADRRVKIKENKNINK